jgi:DHA1 family multidrug resistance protein-like MFS transporter
MNKTDSKRRGLIMLLFFTFFMVSGFEMIMPLIIGHYVNDMGMAATTVAAALAVRQFSQQGLALAGGALADRFQARALISIGVLLRMIGFSALAFASCYGLLLVAMVLIGLGGVLFEMPYQSAVALLTTDENRPRYYSLNNTVTGVASAIGPLLGALLLRIDFRLACFGAALCFFVNFAIAILLMPPVPRKEKPLNPLPAARMIGKDKPYLLFVLIMMTFWLGASQIDISYPLRVAEVYGSADGVGVMYTVYAVVMAVFQYPLVALANRRFSPRISAAIGIGVVMAALATAAYARSPFLFMLNVAAYAAGMILARPNQQNIAVSMSDPRALGMYLGVNSMAFAIGKGVGAIIGGVSFDLSMKHGLGNAPWFMFAAFAAVSMVGFLAQKDLKD